jgi:hypothetical protein
MCTVVLPLDVNPIAVNKYINIIIKNRKATVLHCIVLHCIVLHCIVLHCIVLE